MLLTSEEAKKCEANALGTCGVASPIYAAKNHRLCAFELLRGYKKRIEDSCQIKVLTDTGFALPNYDGFFVCSSLLYITVEVTIGVRLTLTT